MTTISSSVTAPLLHPEKFERHFETIPILMTPSPVNLRERAFVKVSLLHPVLTKIQPVLADLRARLEAKVVEIRSTDTTQAWRWAGIATAVPRCELQVDAKLRHFTPFLRSKVEDEDAPGSMTLTAMSILACGSMKSGFEWLLSTLRAEGLLFTFEPALAEVISTLTEVLADVPDFPI